MHWQPSEVTNMGIMRRQWFVDKLSDQKEYEQEQMKKASNK